jgi:adenylyltransferase/sulfurtransferase
MTTDGELRYARQVLIPGWGEETQQRLTERHVFVAGAGGLGSPVSIYLAAAGVGRLTVVDVDVVEASNLNRQILHDETRIGHGKADSARRTLARVNPSVRIHARRVLIEESNVDDLVGDADVVVDCMDNFPTRYVLNDCAIRKGVPFVFGSIWGLHGQLSVFHVPQTACLRCVFREAPPRETFPVLGATPGVIGTWQALETLKHLTGVGTPLKGRLLSWDGMESETETFRVVPDPDCPSCRAVRG